MVVGLTGHRTEYDGTRRGDVPPGRERFPREESIFNDFSTDVVLQRDCPSAHKDEVHGGFTGCRHVCAETESCNVDE